ncbi:MAG: sensor histidine kinase [Nitrospinaceae bacterium]|nr:MAG: sensor histidine kinase [Nitrospinaceae bacterium]
MSKSLQGKTPKEEFEILNQAFQAFNEATQQLQDSYDDLKERVKLLDLELAKKNEELEKNLTEKEEVKNYLNNILESLTTGVIVVDKEGNITTFNKTAGWITGLTPESCFGKPLPDLFHDDLFENIVSRLTKTGGIPLSVDREIEAANGRKIHIRASASPVLDPEEEQIGTVLIVQDMTQVRQLEIEAQRNQRLRAMGEMAAGIAHEIRNPLGSIELFASMLKKDVEPDEEKSKLVEHIRSGVKNMDRIISTLLLFAKSPRPSQQKCNISQLLSNLLEGTPDLIIPETIKIIRTFGNGDMLANGDQELLKQVFINLIRNAVQAMPDGGELSLTTQKVSASSDRDHRQFITITVSDTGKGIPSDTLAKIFNPFFSTKDKGTGLGLSISHNIIKAHQGTIDAESEKNKGTTFIVKLPSWDNEFDGK